MAVEAFSRQGISVFPEADIPTDKKDGKGNEHFVWLKEQAIKIPRLLGYFWQTIDYQAAVEDNQATDNFRTFEGWPTQVHLPEGEEVKPYGRLRRLFQRIFKRERHYIMTQELFPEDAEFITASRIQGDVLQQVVELLDEVDAHAQEHQKGIDFMGGATLKNIIWKFPGAVISHMFFDSSAKIPAQLENFLYHEEKFKLTDRRRLRFKDGILSGPLLEFMFNLQMEGMMCIVNKKLKAAGEETLPDRDFRLFSLARFTARCVHGCVGGMLK